ncbi:hypothetical protein CHL78_003780 [Romboutsia weinsteinii]|uniref:Uncharacterized protein n=1 Tax=Romboutsia weinsteinii TaxID=2020949 RepID=A0A371J8G3_9FIRM|nr:hypothetical protein [Romboutsia weinsteinii]RDY29049.1 hypothetical protein CHL78_003780 [Romboutsia weinsteinii]
MAKQIVDNSEERFVKIRILSHSGDKIHLKLPIDFVKKMVKNNALDFFNTADDIIDSKKLLNMLLNAFDYNLLGEIAHLERNNGDVIRIRID